MTVSEKISRRTDLSLISHTGASSPREAGPEPSKVKDAAKRVFSNAASTPSVASRNDQKSRAANLKTLEDIGSATEVVVRRGSDSPTPQTPPATSTEQKSPAGRSKAKKVTRLRPSPLSKTESMTAYFPATASIRQKRVGFTPETYSPPSRAAHLRSSKNTTIKRGKALPEKKGPVAIEPKPSSGTPPVSSPTQEESRPDIPVLTLSPALIGRGNRPPNDSKHSSGTLGSDEKDSPGSDIDELLLDDDALQHIELQPRRPVFHPDLNKLKENTARPGPTQDDTKEEKPFPLTKAKCPIEIDPKIRAKFANKPHGAAILKEMTALMNGLEYQIPCMEEPSMEVEDYSEDDEAPSRPLTVDTINVHVLNSLFPMKLAVPRKQVAFDAGVSIDIEHITATPDQISKHPLTNEEVKRVTGFSFCNCDIQPKQLVALAARFPHVEELVLSLCTELDDLALIHSNFKHLKVVHIRFCPKVTALGIESLNLETLEEFGLSTEKAVKVSTLGKVAQSKELRVVDLTMCDRLTPEGVFCFKEAHQSKLITMTVRGCDLISWDTISELNKGREIFPISVILGPYEQADRLQAGLPVFIKPPPPISDDRNDILSLKLSRKVFPDKSDLPHRTLIEEYDFATEIVGINLTGKIPTDLIQAMIDKYPGMEIIRIYDTDSVGHGEIIELRQLKGAKRLDLWKLPIVTAKMIELMFSDIPPTSDSPGVETWLELEEAYLAGMPVTDNAVQLLSRLPRLKSLNLSGCNQLTVQALKHLERGCPSLTRLTIDGCVIDAIAIEEFRKTRDEVTLQAEIAVDESAVNLARAEVGLRMDDESISTEYILLQRYGIMKEEFEEKRNKIFEFYRSRMAALRIRITLDEESDFKQKCLEWDLFLQAYMNISRASGAIRRELYQVGFFLPGDTNDLPPQSVDALIGNLYLLDDNYDPGQYLRKVQMLNFDDTYMTFIPTFVLKFKWPQVRTIRLRTTEISSLLLGFREQCPKLRVIEDDKKREEIEAKVQTPRTKHLSPLPVMKDPLPPAPKNKFMELISKWRRRRID